jgi:hypothetical protein
MVTQSVGLVPYSSEERSWVIPADIRMMRDGYAHAAKSMHSLIILFLWERFV